VVIIVSIIAGLLICAVFLLDRLERFRREKSTQGRFSRAKFLSEAERSFFGVLAQASEEFHVFAKVRLADVVEPSRNGSRSDWRRAFNSICAKPVDFVLCQKTSLKVVAVVELDDKSHERPDRRLRDALVDSALKDAGIPVLRILAARSYSPALLRAKIREAISGQLDTSSRGSALPSR